LQNWGDYTDMSQAVLAYATYASDVFLICWCGAQLTQNVRQNGFYYCCWRLYHIIFIMGTEPQMNWEIMAQI